MDGLKAPDPAKYGIKAAFFLKQVRKHMAINKGEWPDTIIMPDFQVPTEVMLEFLQKFERQRYRSTITKTLVTRSELLTHLIFAWSNGLSIDFSKSLFEQLAVSHIQPEKPRKKRIRPPGYVERRGRPRKQMKLNLEPAQPSNHESDTNKGKHDVSSALAFTQPRNREEE